MTPHFSLLFVFSLVIATSFASAADSDGDDAIIRQVVGEDHQLNYENHFSLFKSKVGKSYATKEEHDHRVSMLRWCRGGLPGRCMPEFRRRFGALAVELVFRRGGGEAGARCCGGVAEATEEETLS
ncbi:unnamed protein product [Camellia sinensis]